MPGTALIASSSAAMSASMRAESPRQELGDGLADVADAEPEEQSESGCVLRRRDGLHQLLGRLLGEPLELHQLRRP